MIDTFVDNLTLFSLNPTILSLIVIIFIGLYIRQASKLTLWSSRGISGPKPKFFSGNFHELVNKPMPEVYSKWCKEFGRFFGVYEGTKPVIFTTDPEIIKEVFIKNGHIFTDRRLVSGDIYQRSQLIAKRGDDWKADRRILSPSFTSGKMKAMFSLMYECYKKLEAEMDRVAQSNKEVDAKILFSKLTSTVIARCAFATVIDPYTNENDPLLNNLHGMFKASKFRMILLRFLPPWIKNTLGFSATPDASKYVRQVCKEIVKRRKENIASGSENYSDLIQLLIDAGNEMIQENSTPDHEAHHGMEDDADAVKSINSTIKSSMNGKKTLNEQEIIANVILFFVAGFETTSTLLNFASFVLTTRQDVQEKLYKELKTVYDQKNGQFDYETLASHAYLDSFICETLRIYSPANQVERHVAQDFKLSNGFLLKQGDLISVPICVLHHDPEFFEYPEKFDIERFLPENRGKIAPCTYLPFGTGPRNCIGMRFSLMEAKMALANLMMKYKFVSTPRTTSRLEFRPLAVVLTPKEPTMIKVEKR